MKTINKVILLGNISHIGEMQFLPNGDNVLKIGLATTDYDKEGQAKPCFHTIVVFKQLAEIIVKMEKGNRLYIEGVLKPREFLNKDGIKKRVVEIIAKEVVFL